eukprot:3857691-Alexandrium_andersonii.AAC.1
MSRCARRVQSCDQAGRAHRAREEPMRDARGAMGDARGRARARCADTRTVQNRIRVGRQAGQARE